MLGIAFAQHAQFGTSETFAYYDDIEFNTVTYANIPQKTDGKDFKEIDNEVHPVSIEIATLPTKNTYITGNALTLDGGAITVTFDNNTTEPVALADAKVTGFDTEKLGAQTLTVEIRIVDMSGRTVKTIKDDSQRIEIPMQPRGIYIVIPFIYSK